MVDPSHAEAEKHKEAANECVKNSNFEEAVKNYNKAITLNPDSPVYYSNRSAAFAGLGKYESALKDAERCLDLEPDFIKGFSRKGFALFKLGKYEEAEKCYRDGLTVDPENAALKESAAAIRRTLDAHKKKASAEGGLFDSVGGFFGKVMNGDHSARLILYAVLFGAYFMFYRGRSATPEADDSGVALQFQIQLDNNRIIRGTRSFGNGKKPEASTASAAAASTSGSGSGHATLSSEISEEEDGSSSDSLDDESDTPKLKELDAVNPSKAPTSFIFLHAWGLSCAEFSSRPSPTGKSDKTDDNEKKAENMKTAEKTYSLWNVLRKKTDANFLSFDLPCHGWSTCWAGSFAMSDYESIAKKLIEKQKDFLGERRVLVVSGFSPFLTRQVFDILAPQQVIWTDPLVMPLHSFPSSNKDKQNLQPSQAIPARSLEEVTKALGSNAPLQIVRDASRFLTNELPPDTMLPPAGVEDVVSATLGEVVTVAHLVFAGNTGGKNKKGGNAKRIEGFPRSETLGGGKVVRKVVDGVGWNVVLGEKWVGEVVGFLGEMLKGGEEGKEEL